MAKLPGIGRKTALRLVLHLLEKEEDASLQLAESIVQLRQQIQYCKKCHNIADDDLCKICSNTRRDGATICVVQDIRDVMAIENTHQYNGLYHVLGGIINPLEGVGPEQLNIASLVARAESTEEPVKEIILALSATMEADTTAYYLTKKLKHLPLQITSIARGIPVGGELEYADEVTLGRSISTRTTYRPG